MGDQTDLKTTVETLAAAVKTLQATTEANTKAILALSADRSSSSSKQPTGEHHTDRPPRFQKMDFLWYDGKSDPLILSIDASRTSISSGSWRKRRFGWRPTT